MACLSKVQKAMLCPFFHLGVFRSEEQCGGPLAPTPPPKDFFLPSPHSPLGRGEREEGLSPSDRPSPNPPEEPWASQRGNQRLDPPPHFWATEQRGGAEIFEAVGRGARSPVPLPLNHRNQAGCSPKKGWRRGYFPTEVTSAGPIRLPLRTARTASAKRFRVSSTTSGVWAAQVNHGSRGSTSYITPRS